MTEELTLEQVKTLFPPRDENSNKSDFGYVALVGGCLKYSGAIRLADMANTAMRCGAGVATLAVPRNIVKEIAPQILESTIFPLSAYEGHISFKENEFDELMRKNKVIAFGMGIGNSEATRKALSYLLSNYDGTLIVDADGINAMAKLSKKLVKSHKCKLVLTPHPKEFSRLSKLPLEDVLADPQGQAQKLAKDLGAVVLLKGHTTYISDGEKTYQVTKGTAGMATAGSGDVLSGILAAMVFGKEDLCLATAGAAYINGLAGEIATRENSETTLVASDTANCIKKAIEELAEKKPETRISKGFNLKFFIPIVIAALALGFCVAWAVRGQVDNKAFDVELSQEEDYIKTMDFLPKDIYIDGKLVNNYELYRPFTRIDGRVYVPLTEDVCRALGITAKWEGRHPKDIYITQDVASHEGVFYDIFGWNLKEVTGWAKANVALHLSDGNKEEVLHPEDY